MTDYWKMPDDTLINLLFTEADSLPRAAVDEFLKRGHLVDRLGRIVSDPYSWNEPLPAWWAVTHAVYILGAFATAETVLPLLRALRYAEACENDWVTEDLPAIFGRVGLPAVEGLRNLAGDRTTGWLARAMALEGLAAVALRHPETAEEQFRFIHAFFAQPDEDRKVRQMAGHVLLDVLRQEHRAELVAFGSEERVREERDPAYQAAFWDSDVEHEFQGGRQALERYTRDWLVFYTPEAAKERRDRWAEEHRTHADAPEHASDNELCPFAADRKRKKCCMGRAGIA
jgi:hypothetical protein